MTGRPDNSLVKAVTGLEGGCVACGSTCGVVSNAALSLALAHEPEVSTGGSAAKREILLRVGEFIRWFEATYGSFRCRDRSRSDFYSKWGQLMYFLTFYRMAGCFRHIRGTMRYLYEYHNCHEPLPLSVTASDAVRCGPHCAVHVLKNIRKLTGVGSRRMESLAFVFDGGVGLSGGLCGALAGAVIGINALLGLPVRDQSFWKTAAVFAVGHINLVVERPFGKNEPFAAGQKVVRKFKEMAGSTECRTITGRTFSGWDDFQAYISEAESCRKLMDFAVEQADNIIRQNQ